MTLTRRDAIAIAVVLLAGLGLAGLAVIAAGAVGVPTNDDWVYMHAADSLYRSQTIDISGHSAAFIGQLALVQPLLWISGGAPWAYLAYGLLGAGVALASTFILARQFVGLAPALVVTILVVVFPGFLRGVGSFMTDVPAFALTMLSLLLGVRWIQEPGSRRFLIAAVAAGVLGVSIREFALAAPVSVLLTAWLRRPSGDLRGFLLVASVGTVAAVIAVLALAGSLPNDSQVGRPFIGRLILLIPTFTTLAAGLLPALVLGIAGRIRVIPVATALLAATVVLVAFTLPISPIVGNYWLAKGVVGNIPVLPGTRNPVIPDAAWALTEQLALVAGTLLASLVGLWTARVLRPTAGVASARARARAAVHRPTAPLVVFLVLYAMGMGLIASIGPIFDRYLYPVLPVAGILVLRHMDHAFRSPRAVAVATAAMLWLTVSALAVTAGSLAFDAGRWRAGEASVALGYDAAAVDAGLEWVAAHARQIEDPGTITRNHGVTAYDDWLMPSPPCAVVAASPIDLPGYELIAVKAAAFERYLILGPAQPLYLYRSTGSGCPVPSGAPDGWDAA